MFCPKCGNEITKDTKFCSKCGWQIVKETVVEREPEDSASKKADVGKIILIAVISIVVIVIALLVANKIGHSGTETANEESTQDSTQDKGLIEAKEERGFASYEDAVDALMTASYAKDVEAVIECFPEEMESYVKQLYNEYRSGNFSDLEVGFFGFTKLNPDNEYYYKIREAVEYDPSQKYSYFTALSEDVLRTEYGLNVDEIYMIDMSSRGKYYTYMLTEEGGYMDDGVRSYLEVAKIGNKWFIVQPGYLWNNFWYEEALQTE